MFGRQELGSSIDKDTWQIQVFNRWSMSCASAYERRATPPPEEMRFALGDRWPWLGTLLAYAVLETFKFGDFFSTYCILHNNITDYPWKSRILCSMMFDHALSFHGVIIWFWAIAWIAVQGQQLRSVKSNSTAGVGRYVWLTRKPHLTVNLSSAFEVHQNHRNPLLVKNKHPQIKGVLFSVIFNCTSIPKMWLSRNWNDQLLTCFFVLGFAFWNWSCLVLFN